MANVVSTVETASLPSHTSSRVEEERVDTRFSGCSLRCIVQVPREEVRPALSLKIRDSKSGNSKYGYADRSIRVNQFHISWNRIWKHFKSQMSRNRSRFQLGISSKVHSIWFGPVTSNLVIPHLVEFIKNFQ